MANYRYQIVLNGSLNEDNKNVIVSLYQPILGLVPTQIYFSLVEEEKLMKRMPKSVFTESQLAGVLGLDIPQLKEALSKLEGMNLVKTFVNRITKTLTYKIQKPLEPKLFFENVLFNDVLKQKIGDERYEMVKVFYLSENNIEDEQQLEEQTAKFEEAFSSEYQIFKNTDVQVAPEINEDLVDFNVISQQMVLKNMKASALTQEVKTIILANLANIEFTNEELVDVINEAYNFKKDAINLDHLKVLLKDLVVKKTDDSDEAVMARKIKEMETKDAIAYASMLEEQPCNRTTANIISNLKKRIFKDKKPENDGVINCLLEFSYWKNNCKIVGNYLYKIADSIVEKGLDTTKKVMDYLRNVATYTKTKVHNVKTNFKSKKIGWVKEQISNDEPVETEPSTSDSIDKLKEWANS